VVAIGALKPLWSTDWFRNPRAEIKVLKEAIDSALAEAKARGVDESEGRTPVALLGPEEEDAVPVSDQESPKKTRTGPKSAPAALAQSAQRPKPEQKSLQFEPPVGSDLFTVANGFAAEPTVALGSPVTIENITDGKKLAFTLVEGENAPDDGKIGVQTPLGQAVLEAQVGDEVEYQVGSHIKEVPVLEVR